MLLMILKSPRNNKNRLFCIEIDGKGRFFCFIFVKYKIYAIKELGCGLTVKESNRGLFFSASVAKKVA